MQAQRHMPKRPFIRKIKRKRHGASFWDYEYTEGGNLKLSVKQSEDLEKFIRWHNRQKDTLPFDSTTSVMDLGCGNGRNVVYLAQTFGMTGHGYDISSAAVEQANALGKGLEVTFTQRSIAGDINLPDSSQDLVLDMMTSHFLSDTERNHMRAEVYRVLKPGGWFFMKTFLADGDLHTKRLLKDSPGTEENTYIHPVIGVPEHVYDEKALMAFLEESFVIHKVYKSHKHILKGKARKRRTISVYAQKDPYR